MLVSIVSVRKTRGRELFQLFIERFQHLAWTRLKTSERCEELIPTSVRLNVDPFWKCVMKIKEVPEPVLEPLMVFQDKGVLASELFLSSASVRFVSTQSFPWL